MIYGCVVLQFVTNNEDLQDTEEHKSTYKNQEVKIPSPSLTNSEISSSSDTNQETETRLKRRMANKRKYNTYPLLLQARDILGAKITSSVLTISHYYEWCTNIRLALEAKMKLGFIDGTFKMSFDAEETVQWRLVDVKDNEYNGTELEDSFSKYCNSSTIMERYHKNL